MDKKELITFFHDSGLVPVVAIKDAAKAVPLAKAMMAGGIFSAEVTFRTAAAEEAIRNIATECPEMVVGAGTVISPALAEKAVAAGAQFIVSPGFNPATVEWCISHDVPVVPGVATPSEIERALSYGLDVLKFFPAESSGGVKMLKDLSGPFGQVRFMTTGGINPANLGDYAKATNVLAIGGSWMVKGDLIDAENWAEITRLCAEANVLLQGMTLAHVGVNSTGPEEAMEFAQGFSQLGLAIKEGNSSIFLNADIEVMKKPNYGKHGHIGFKVYDVERTIYFLKNKGFTVNPDSVKLDAKGKIKFCYLNEEIGGFAIHLGK